ncbi:MAG TPA: tRNA preQ1(34) S-adenosylmethionine ribosyltransferase-isomerase QueA [Acidimicrobiia bacterium]|nr:tRNA preQ1(34) S-adenosylmethionine ribosyltransferase-isomerase QueA [Acidimicrobiia bacterium]
MRTADFHYDLPDDAIAQSAVQPRDSARLLDTRDMSDHRFKDLPSLLREGDLVVVNRTRVRPARLHGVKEGTGGRVEALLLRPGGDGSWEALVRPARRIHEGTRLRFGEVRAVVAGSPAEGRVVLLPEKGSLDEAMAADGEIPLPPYFHGHLDDPELYQTVYADRPGSVAAPTAGLHFTRAVLDDLERRGIDRAAVDLEIGLDTFRPISADVIESHRMHQERMRVDDDAAIAVKGARERGGRIVAIGTTVVRALESAATGDGLVEPGEGDTSLFITPGYRFTVVDLLVTNFHVPASTLVVLVAAFMGPGWRSAYAGALARGYRFLSFGDAMLGERAP